MKTLPLALALFLVLISPCDFAEAIPFKTASTPAECGTHLDYEDAGHPLAPDFVVRGGYSRDNDDAPEGNYETAVFDVELAGRTIAQNKTCLHLAVTPVLSSEQENAAGWAKSFFLRPAQVHRHNASTGGWELLFDLASKGFAFSVLSFKTPSYELNGKLAKPPHSFGPTVGIRSVAYLGTVGDGQYAGRAFLQTEGKGFSNTDDVDYNVVRHVLQWALALEEGLPVGSTAPYSVAGAGGAKILRFPSEVRFVTPQWHGTEVVVGGKKEVKNHSVALMWKDVVFLDAKRAGGPQFVRLDLLPTRERALAADATLTSDETLGRFKAKPTARSKPPAPPRRRRT